MGRSRSMGTVQEIEHIYEITYLQEEFASEGE
jgi:hypothetical protein